MDDTNFPIKLTICYLQGNAKHTWVFFVRELFCVMVVDMYSSSKVSEVSVFENKDLWIVSNNAGTIIERFELYSSSKSYVRPERCKHFKNTLFQRSEYYS